MKIISLSHNVNGTACSIAVAIKKYFYNDDKQTELFDFLTISMKSVNEIITGMDITGFIRNISNYENMVQFKNFDKIISCHDIDNYKRKDPSMNDIEIDERLTNQYNRRRNRLLTTLRENPNEETIYFLRYCTDFENIQHNEVMNFMNNIKNINKDLVFHLILITTNYKEHKTTPPLKLLNQYSNLHMLYLDNYLTNEENKLNHFEIYNAERFDKFVGNLNPIYNFVNNIENKINKNAVVILTRGYNDIKKYFSLIQRNKSISKNLNDKTTDILIFHEGNITLTQQDYIKKFTPNLNIKFIVISDKAFLKSNERFQFYDPTKREIWNHGYRHMCHFWFLDFLHFCHEYEHILRIDEDCFVDFNIDEIFKLLPTKVLIAGAIDKDEEIVTTGLNDFTLNFLRKNSIKRRSKSPGGPYTNVFALNLLRIRKNNFLKKYMDEIDKSNNIYIYRWGDLPLWGEVMEYFYDKKDFLIYNRINYYHGSLNTYVNNLTNNMKEMILIKKQYDKKIQILKQQENNSNFSMNNSHQLLFQFQR